MEFLRRLKYYLIGVGLGILLVLAIFKDRKLTSWTPKNQILKEIAENKLVLNPVIHCKLDCIGLSDEISLKSYLAEGDIDFSKSNVSNIKSRIYVLSFDEGKATSMEVNIREDEIEVLSFSGSLSSCNCPD